MLCHTHLLPITLYCFYVPFLLFRSYYEKKAEFHATLEKRKSVIEKLQVEVIKAKKLYSGALANLENISEEIHEHRQSRKLCGSLGERGAGVGSESPAPPPHDKVMVAKAINNNDLSQHAEIIISFPPVDTKARINCSRLSSPPARLVVNNRADSPINIDHVQITVVPAKGNNSNLESVSESKPTVADDSIQSGTNVSKTTDTDISGCTGESSADNYSVQKGIEKLPSLIGSPARPEGSSGGNSTNVSPLPYRQHKRVPSFPIQLSAKRLLQETSSINSVNSDTSSVHSFTVLDDEGVQSAMSEHFFNGTFDQNAQVNNHDDYSKLPDTLAHYQGPYESTRQSFPQLQDVDLKLEQVLKLLDSSQDESAV